jgi:PAN domain
MQKARHAVGYVIAGVVGGVVLAQIAGGFVLAGVAPLVQGWSKGEQDQLALLGEGGCRLADGGEGNPVHLAGLSSERCQAECISQNGKCSAVEYNTNNGQCEVHSEPIVKFEAVEGVFCYLRN